MTYEKFVKNASEIFLTVFEKTNNQARASLLVSDFCTLHGQTREFAAKLCFEFRKALSKNLHAKA